jgi:hypothetical protein
MDVLRLATVETVEEKAIRPGNVLDTWHGPTITGTPGSHNVQRFRQLRARIHADTLYIELRRDAVVETNDLDEFPAAITPLVVPSQTCCRRRPVPRRLALPKCRASQSQAGADRCGPAAAPDRPRRR